jgi:hypothetical protein
LTDHIGKDLLGEGRLALRRYVLTRTEGVRRRTARVRLQHGERRERTKQTATEYQEPIRGRLAIWKKKFSGG